MSALAELDRLREQVRRAEARRRRVEQDRLAARRALATARAPLVAYLEQVEAGRREPDAREEKRLTQAVGQAAAYVESRPLHVDGRVAGYEDVDVRVEARAAGAERAVADARGALVAFLGSRLDDLAAERLEGDRELAARVGVALEGLRALGSGWARSAAWWGRLMREAGLGHLAERMPPNPAVQPPLGEPSERDLLPVPGALLDRLEAPEPETTTTTTTED